MDSRLKDYRPMTAEEIRKARADVAEHNARVMKGRPPANVKRPRVQREKPDTPR